MDAYSAVKIGFGQTCTHANSETLDHFSRLGSHDMEAEHAVGFAVHQNLHQCFLFSPAQRVLHRRELRTENPNRGALVASFLFGQANARRGWLAEDRGRYVGMIDRTIHAAELRVGKCMTFHQRHRRERDPVGHVADGIDTVYRSSIVLVDRDQALGPGCDFGILQSELPGVGVPSGSEQNNIELARSPVGKIHMALAVIGFGNLSGVVVVMELDAPAQHARFNHAPDVTVEVAQNSFAPVVEHYLRAETAEYAREFHRDVAAADDQHALRKLGQIECIIGNDAKLCTGNVESMGSSADRDQDPLGTDAAFADQHGVFVEQRAATRIHFHAGVRQQLAVNTFQPCDLALLGRHHVSPAEAGLAYAPTVAGRVLEGFAELAGEHEQLLWYASADDAGAAQSGFLAQADTGAVAGRNPRRPNTTGSTSDHEKIIVKICHQSSCQHPGR